MRLRGRRRRGQVGQRLCVQPLGVHDAADEAVGVGGDLKEEDGALRQQRLKSVSCSASVRDLRFLTVWIPTAM